MLNTNFKQLQHLLSTMLDSIVEPGVLGGGQYRSIRYFPGDQSSMTLLQSGLPILAVVPDANIKLGSSFSLVDDGYDAYENFVDELNKDDIIRNKVGRNALEQEVEGLLRAFKEAASNDATALDTAIRDAIRRLKGLVKNWNAIVPVDNLELIGLTELVLGRVTFRPTAILIPHALQEANQLLDTSSSSEITRQATKQGMWEYFAHNFGTTKICATVVVVGEQSRLPFIVDDEVDASLNVLRCFMSLLFPRGYRNYIGLRGEVLSAGRPCLGLTNHGGAWNFSVRQVGAFYPYEISPKNLEYLKSNCAFDILSVALAKTDPPPTEFERILLISSRWLGRGVVATDNAEKVLNLSVALERLICGDKRELIAETLARRMAFLLGTTFDTRQQVFRRVKKLYGLRSKVVHEGKTEVADEDINELEYLACVAFIAMAKRVGEWQKITDFIDWVEEQTFTLPANSTAEESTDEAG